MSISFNEIPADIRVPGTYIEVDPSAAGSGSAAFRLLAFGQMLAAGSAVADTVVQVSSKTRAEALFGRGSMIANMCAALLLAHPLANLWAMPVDDAGGGTEAAGVLTGAGTATENGTVHMYVNGRYVPVGVTSGDDQDDIRTAITAKFAEASFTDLECTISDNASPALNDVDAKHKGTTGNAIDIRFNPKQGQSFPAGYTCTVSTPMAGGATDPTLTTAIANLGDVKYKAIASNWSDDTNLGAIETDLATRWGPTTQIFGHVFACHVDTHANLITYGNTRNSPHSTAIGVANPMTPPWVMAADLCGAAAKSLEIDPARPLQTLELKSTVAPAIADRFIFSERDLLLRDGIATFRVSDDDTVRLERIVTTYQTNAGGAPDSSLMQVETLYTLMLMREELKSRFDLKYPRHKLADDGTEFDPGQAVMTPLVAKAEYVDLARAWERRGLMENVKDFKDAIISERNAGDVNRLDALLSPDLINQFMVHAVQLQFRA